MVERCACWSSGRGLVAGRLLDTADAELPTATATSAAAAAQCSEAAIWLLPAEEGLGEAVATPESADDNAWTEPYCEVWDAEEAISLSGPSSKNRRSLADSATELDVAVAEGAEAVGSILQASTIRPGPGPGLYVTGGVSVLLPLPDPRAMAMVEALTYLASSAIRGPAAKPAVPDADVRAVVGSVEAAVADAVATAKALPPASAGRMRSRPLRKRVGIGEQDRRSLAMEAEWFTLPPAEVVHVVTDRVLPRPRAVALRCEDELLWTAELPKSAVALAWPCDKKEEPMGSQGYSLADGRLALGEIDRRWSREGCNVDGKLDLWVKEPWLGIEEAALCCACAGIVLLVCGQSPAPVLTPVHSTTPLALRVPLRPPPWLLDKPAGLPGVGFTVRSTKRGSTDTCDVD